MKMPTNMNHNFAQVPKAEIRRSSFNRSHTYKTTFDAGFLVPIFCDEVLPGDTFNLSLNHFARLATPIKPTMDNIYLDTFFFFVPNRLLWDNHQKFHGEQKDPGDSTSFLVPTMDAPAGGHLVHSLSDYLGIPTEIATLEHISLYHRAYNLIYNEWFRDQNLQNSVVVDTDDGPDTSTDYSLLRRGKRHDYFTACLPFTQKGTEVTIPLGTNAPIYGVNMDFDGNDDTGNHFNVLDAPSGTLKPLRIGSSAVYGGTAASGTGQLLTDLTNATAATINSLRLAFQIQRLFERDARGGTRYTEIIRSHFGVTSPDSRLQRPEYLGGGSSPINMHPVANTSDTATENQGDLSAFATSSANGHGFVKSFTEHGIIIGIISARADLTYQQGLDRKFSRSERLDYFIPVLANIGEQSVLNKEIFADASPADDTVFGFQERYAEYRYFPSKITGKFRSTFATSLDFWHLSQEFGSLPVLNAAFIEENPPIDRIIAVPAEPHFIYDSFVNLTCARPMPTYGVPGMMDHF